MNRSLGVVRKGGCVFEDSMIRAATALIVLLFTAEVRSETVDVKYRGTVDLKRRSSVATRQEAVSFGAFVTTKRKAT
jgi:hypothetical protein